MAITLALKVTPASHRNEITGYENGVLAVKIAAPADRGKANRELIKFLSERLGVSKSSLAVIKGQTARHKLLSISGLTQDQLTQRLS